MLVLDKTKCRFGVLTFCGIDVLCAALARIPTRRSMRHQAHESCAWRVRSKTGCREDIDRNIGKRQSLTVQYDQAQARAFMICVLTLLREQLGMIRIFMHKSLPGREKLKRIERHWPPVPLKRNCPAFFALCIREMCRDFFSHGTPRTLVRS